jgi:hypothetical protein
MKYTRYAAVFLWIYFASLSCLAADISGKVTDGQGTAIAEVSISVEMADGRATDIAAVTGKDGTFAIAELGPASYVLVARKPGFAEVKTAPIQIGEAVENRSVNLRLVPVREVETVRGAEERNPNDFVIRLDTNSIKNELTRVGISPRLIQEFRVTSSYYGEQFGYTLRPIPTTSARRPISDVHGAVYEFHQDNALNARPFFQVGGILPSRRNQYGFSFESPIKKERLWFDFAWGQIKDSGFVNGDVQVPLASERTPRSSDPQMNAIIGALLKAFPVEVPNLPQVSLRHLNTNSFRDTSSTAFSWHVDYRSPSGDTLAIDHQFQDSTEEPFQFVAGQNPRTLSRPQSIGVNYSHAFSATTAGQIGLNYRRLAVQLLLTQRYLDLVPKTLLPLGTPDVSIGEDVSQIGMVNRGMPRSRFENHYYLTPQITQTRGRQTIFAGGTVLHQWDTDVRSSNARGTIHFAADCISTAGGPCIPRSAVENFLAGTATRMSITRGNQHNGYRNWEYGFFVQDRVRLRPNFTLQGGLRYELQTVPHEVKDFFKLEYKTDANNFAPQIGFAWNPGSGQTVLRGGYGVAFGSITVGTFSRQASSTESVKSANINTPTLQDWVNPNFESRSGGSRTSVNRIEPGTVLPYVQTYNVFVERELPWQSLLRAGYLGSRALKMLYGATLNTAVPVPGIPATSATVNQRRPDPRYSRIFTIMNASTAYFDGLQLAFAKRRSAGLNFEAVYSFSKSIDTAVGNFAETGSGDDASQTEEIVSDVKAVSSFDTPHSFTINYSYALPRLGNGASWFAMLFRDWVVSGTTVFRSGTPFTVYTGSDSPGFGNVDGEEGDRPNIKNPALHGTSVDNPDTSAAIMGADTPCIDRGGYMDCKYFDTNIAPGGRGSLGYRTLRKDGTNNWNFAVGRNFMLSGSEKQLQFRTEFFNFLNHAQFAAPGIYLTTPTFGKITNTVNKGRVIQLTLRYSF